MRNIRAAAKLAQPEVVTHHHGGRAVEFRFVRGERAAQHGLNAEHNVRDCSSPLRAT